ncbi:uncharacterized protein LOC129612578 [Condylostylus longicornis]|uniref:uncharacterized protein LOC129612578 n=1 Tax=Condylostylus longicornis TaxID=2530218 RepID=UPI00244E5777|nr:uncharacterized protein LOC129612578 [Condylostylus longicornis]
MTVVRIEGNGGNLLMSSVYMAHDRPAPPPEVQNLAEVGAAEGASLLMGCDANARHTLWGSTEINERGESLFNFVLDSNLEIANRGNTPTFTFPSTDRFAGWEDVIDITLKTNNCIIEDWRVSSKRSYSDHAWIVFTVGFEVGNPKPFRNPKRTDWVKFRAIVRAKLMVMPDINNYIKEVEELDAQISRFEKVMGVAFRASCPLKYSKKKYPPWWNEDLSNLRKITRDVFNICYKNGFWQPYKECLREYKRAIRSAKSQGWRDFCGTVECTRDSARLSRVLSKDHTGPSFLKDEGGTWTKTSMETLNLLVDTHFPGNTGSAREAIQLDSLPGQPVSSEMVEAIIAPKIFDQLV